MDGEWVSNLWFPLLHDIRAEDDVHFHVNEARRTKARQAELIREKGLYHPVDNPTGAAPVSCVAPHIRCNRADHAIDFDNATGVIVAARERGIHLWRPIGSEPWHTEILHIDELHHYNARRRKAMARLRRQLRAARRRVAKLHAIVRRRSL